MSSVKNSSSLMTNQPIGVFDSGVGGLTVFREIVRELPTENVVYLGDTARLPYGNKSPEAIIQYSLECAQYLLRRHQIKLLVVACHTASAHALEVLQESLPIPVVGVVQPGFERLMETTRNQRVAILATTATIASNSYQHLIQEHYPRAIIYPIACPLFVHLAEEHLFDHPAADLIADHYLRSLRTEDIDAILLACTHFPILYQAIQKALPTSVKIIDPAPCCARQVVHLLSETQNLHFNQSPTHRFLATDHPIRFATLAKTFLGHTIDLEIVRCS